MKVALLIFAGCPNEAPTRALVEEVLREEGRCAALVVVAVEDEASARTQRFPGSPSVRVDGVDIEPARRGEETYALACRTYPTDGGGRSGVPPREMIREALLHATAHGVGVPG